jgi:tol-pal system protein YbgF
LRKGPAGAASAGRFFIAQSGERSPFQVTFWSLESGILRAAIPQQRPPMNSTSRAFALSALGAALLCGGTSHAQESGPFDRMFGREPPPQRQAQAAGPDLMMRIDRLENSIRQLTGQIEQLQFRNQQLEQQVKRFQEDTEYRFQEQGGRGGARTPPAAAQGRPQAAPPVATQPAPPPPGRRSDAFDPTQDPNAPGAPRALGSVHSAAPPPVTRAEQPIIAPEPTVGAPGGRLAAGSPLDLSTLSGAAASDPTLAPPAQQQGGALPPPPPRNPNATGALAAVSPPSQTPRDEYDLAYGYVLRKDYALAEQQFRSFLGKYPSDRMAPDALYWLGESLFQRQRYRDAAESFLTVSTKHETTGKAPDALLRLGQSLAALGEKETACATLGEVTRKYPRASVSVKQSVEREQKRVRC